MWQRSAVYCFAFLFVHLSRDLWQNSLSSLCSNVEICDKLLGIIWYTWFPYSDCPCPLLSKRLEKSAKKNLNSRFFSSFRKFGRGIWIENLKVNTMSLSKNKEFCFWPGCKDRKRELKLTCEDCKLAKYCSSECQSSHFVDHRKFCAPAKSVREKATYEWRRTSKGQKLDSMGTRNFGIIFYPQFKNSNFFSMKITSFCLSAGPDTHLLGNMDQIVMFCDAWLFH